jgi:hypothetical protein
MENLFIPYEQALIIKELGFDEPCFGIWERNDKLWFKNYVKGVDFIPEDNILAPLYQQAFRWFREKKYQAEILWRGDFGDFCWKIGRFEQGSHFFSDDGFKTYEEAELECLKKLIEIVKNK